MCVCVPVLTVEQQSGKRRVGSINDYDPMNEHWGSVAPGQHAQYTGGPTSGNQWEERVQLPRQNRECVSRRRRRRRSCCIHVVRL